MTYSEVAKCSSFVLFLSSFQRMGIPMSEPPTRCTMGIRFNSLYFDKIARIDVMKTSFVFPACKFGIIGIISPCCNMGLYCPRLVFPTSATSVGCICKNIKRSQLVPSLFKDTGGDGCLSHLFRSKQVLLADKSLFST